MPETDLSPVDPIRSIVIRPWPKVVMLLPTFLASVICCVITSVSDRPAADASVGFLNIMGVVFLMVLAINLTVLLYDLSFRGFLVVVLALLVLILAIFLLNRQEVIREFMGKVLSVRVYANGAFYGVFSLILLFNLAIAFVITRFHYWIVDHNEIIIHHGFMQEQERHPTSAARFKLQIDDVVEYALFGSGKLIFTFTDEGKDRELSTVLRIRSKARQLDRLLGRVAVTHR